MPLARWKVRNALSQYPTMKMNYSEMGGGFMVTVSYTEQKASTALENVTENVTENRRHRIVALMRETPSITTGQIAETLKVTKRTIMRDVEKLKNEDRIAYIGPARGGYWKVMDRS